MCIRDRRYCFRVLCDYRNLLCRWKRAYAPKTPDEDFHPLFVEALQKQDYCLLYTSMRAMDETGKWLPKSRKVYDLDENGERIRLPSGSWKSHKEDTVDWNDPVSYTHLLVISHYGTH